MKKSIILPSLLLGSVLLVTGCSASKAPTTQVPENTVVNTVNRGEVVTNYKEYSPTLVEQAEAEGKDVALFFHSKTCGSCAKLDADLTANGKNLYPDLAVLKVDWDTNQELARQYNVDTYHTVAFVDGDTSNNVKGLFTTDDVNAAKDLPFAVSE